MKPRLSVVIPAYNEQDYIGRCLSALKQQKGCSAFEVIVVDNGSTDKTVEIVKKRAVRLVKEKRKGVAIARKTGSDFAKGEILVHTDADAAPPKEWLATIEQYFDENPGLVGVSGVMTFYDRAWFMNLIARMMGYVLVGYDRLITFNRCHFNGQNMAVRKWAYDKAGGFNPNLSFGEDIDLARRVWKYGRVNLTPKLKTIASSRRYQWTKGTVLYVLNFVTFTLFKRLVKNEMEDLRKLETTRERLNRSIRSSAPK